MSQNGQHSDGEEIPDNMVDPAEVIDDQSGLMFAWKNTGDGQVDPVEVINSFVPEKNEYHGKTNISLNQARPLAMLLQMEEMFPNIVGDGAYKSVQGAVDNYEQLLTSWKGKSRQELVEVLSSLPGNGEQNVNISRDPEDE